MIYINCLLAEIEQENSCKSIQTPKFNARFGLKITDRQKHLSVINWISEIHKAPVGCRFMIESKQLSTKTQNETISNVFKIKSIILKFQKLMDCRKFFSIVENINNTYSKKNTKTVSNLVFEAFYTFKNKA